MDEFVKALNRYRDNLSGDDCDEARAHVIALHRAALEDAERYRWLRLQHWSDGLMAVVMQPADSIKLGRSAPSRELLDAAIDAALAANGEKGT